MQSNVLLELQGRQWRQVEGWNVRRLGQFAEERALLGLRESVSPPTPWFGTASNDNPFVSGAVGV